MIRDYIPRRTKHKEKTAYESPNMKIWISWGGYPLVFHVSVGPAVFMWQTKKRK